MMEMAEYEDPLLSDTSSINSRRSCILEVNECQVDSATTGSDTGQLPDDWSSDGAEVNSGHENEVARANSTQQPDDWSSYSTLINFRSENDTAEEDVVQLSSSSTDAEEHRSSFHSSEEPLAMQADERRQIYGGHYGEAELIWQLEPLTDRSSSSPTEVEHTRQHGTTTTSSLEYLVSNRSSESGHIPRSSERASGSTLTFSESSESEVTSLASQASSTCLLSGGSAKSIQFPHCHYPKWQPKRKSVLEWVGLCIAVILAIVISIIWYFTVKSATSVVDHNQTVFLVGRMGI